MIACPGLFVDRLSLFGVPQDDAVRDAVCDAVRDAVRDVVRDVQRWGSDAQPDTGRSGLY